ncbi:acetyl-CoA carboxylase biotin carboxyl carrier protein subunit [Aliidiomarina sedimenti]|uniref:Acetyl-CoA carboxylase biotin carboxyl carrier protein subunit n=1 Tax=Aliidiomarina sedimenti TaxID=1933879 RepID=A0ABY0C171_9GAMM|nr:efflux RND transporter periplasmic adaptor subunit [Aliidiomarina sedimenti]RUO30806.1 acetyl-CoA carboxylase biotin carboxyl carrier protein subunit [Aliidiomarina sedimenti]
MNLIKSIFILLNLFIGLAVTQPTYASAESSHGHSETDVNGPNGGTLLTEGDFAVEITIFESGISPEMRVYAYSGGELINPAQVELEVVLHRLGKVNDTLNFTPEDDYLVSNSPVTEPHSYEVSVSASTQHNRGEWHYESFEGRTTLPDRIIEEAGIQVERAVPRTLKFKDRLFGVVAPVSGQMASVTATYRGTVSDVLVTVGEQVAEGQTLARVINAGSGASYEVVSPIAGEVTERFITAGEVANQQVLFEIVDLSSVWVELSAFPENIEKLKVGLQAEVFDLHQHERVSGEIIYIAPVMTGGHIARARVLIDNDHGHWRPGMHVQADVTTGERNVALAVNVDAVQTFRDRQVVFAQYGNTFEVRMLELGDSDGAYIEVKDGLAPNTPYVYGNSYLLKADVLKDGASHDH